MHYELKYSFFSIAEFGLSYTYKLYEFINSTIGRLRSIRANAYKFKELKID